MKYRNNLERPTYVFEGISAAKLDSNCIVRWYFRGMALTIEKIGTKSINQQHKVCLKVLSQTKISFLQLKRLMVVAAGLGGF